METTPLGNILGWGDDETWMDEAMELTSIQMQLGWKCVELHKQKLGPHTRIFTGEFRFWVWEDLDYDWTVLVSNKKGVCFEVATDLSKDQARVAWDHYREKMNG
tara:strand:- start:2090 stop:2401 length:312 start_codon:yes stop_codon:yes gene_type:complete